MRNAEAFNPPEIGGDHFRSAAVFLCDRRNVFHTGDEVTLDGGYTVF